VSAADNVRDEIIADLDARTRRHGTVLDELQGTLGGLGETVTESAGLLAQVIPRLDTLAEQVAEVRGRASTSGDGGTGGEEVVSGVVWETLSADEAAEEWTRLATWVADVLGPWYEVPRGHLPDCWALHRPVVRFLSALHTAYVAAYSGSAASAAAVADWQNRWLPNALSAIFAHMAPRERVCSPGRHDGAGPDGAPVLSGNGFRETGHPVRPATELEQLQAELGRETVYLRDDPIRPEHWVPFWRRAVDADVAARRAREAG